MRIDSSCIKAYLQVSIRRLDIHKQGSTKTPLNRCLDLHHLVFYAVAQMIGAAIYALSGKLIRDDAGAGASLSYIIGSFSALCTGICYAEFASIIPRAGSCYTYTYTIIGELPAFLVGWNMLFDSIIGMAMIAKTFSGTVMTTFKTPSHPMITNYLGSINTTVILSSGVRIFDDSLDLGALGIIMLLIIITMMGSKKSISFISVITMVQLGCLTSIIFACFYYGKIDNWFMNGGFFPFGMKGVLNGAGIALFAFSGFDTLANASEEARDPMRSIPIALFLSLFLVTVLYVSTTLGLTYLVPRLELDYTAPFVEGFARLNAWNFYWIAFVATLLATGVAKISQMFVIPRLIYAMATDGLLFSSLGKVNKNSQVPVNALFWGGSFTALLATTLHFEIITDICSIGIIFSYLMVGINLIVYRYTSDFCSTYEIDENIETNKLISTNNDIESTLQHHNSSEIMKIRPFAVGFASYCDQLKTKKTFLYIFLFVLFAIVLFSGVISQLNELSTTTRWYILIFSSLQLLLSFSLMCIYQPLVRNKAAAFETPFMPLIPFISIVVNTILLYNVSFLQWIRLFTWSFIGLVIYVCYGMKHSKLASTSPSTENL